MNRSQNNAARTAHFQRDGATSRGQLSIEVAACLYVAAVLLGGLAVLGIFSFAHSGLLVATSAGVAIVALAAATYCVRAVVRNVASVRAGLR